MDVNIQFNLLQTIILWAVPLLFAITVHEVAHGWIADRLGDPTAKMLGRLTLNPIKHIDPLGTILLPALSVWLGGFIFGFAKPVPIIWRNLKRPRRDMAMVAFAGPLSNILMAILWGAIAKLGLVLLDEHVVIGVVFEAMGKIGIYVNCMLGVLNLLPLQPLDGGRIVSSLLRGKIGYYYDQLAPYGIIILLLLLATNTLSLFIGAPFHWLYNNLLALFGL